MKAPFITLLLELVVAACLMGCRQHANLKLTTEVAPSQNVETGALVLLADSPQPVGYVRSLGEQRDGRILAELTITNRLGDMRVGTVHLRERGRVVLDTSRVSPTAAQHRNGDVVPLETKTERVARQLGEWPLLIVLLGVLGLIVLGICAVRLLFSKAAGPLVPMALAFVLASFTGWVVGPLLVPSLTPTLDKWWSRVADSSTVPGGHAGGAEARDGASALGRFQTAVTRSLATKPDPRLVSWFVVSTATLPLWILFVCWVRSVSQHCACAVLMAAAIWFGAATTTAAAAADGVLFTREWLRAEQEAAREFLVDVDRRCRTARRWLDADLVRKSEEEIVKANFLLDAAESRLDGHPYRIGKLKGSPLAYIKRDEQKKLLAACESLVEQHRQLQERVSELQRASSAKGGESRLLQGYLSRREHYQQRIARGLTDADTVLVELRQLSVGEPKQQTDENGRQIAELQSTASALRDEVQRLREHIATNKPVVITNLVDRERIVEKPVPTPSAPALEQPARDSARELETQTDASQLSGANTASSQQAEAVVPNQQELGATARQKPADAPRDKNLAAFAPAPIAASSSARSQTPVGVLENAPPPVAERSSRSTPVAPAQSAVRKSPTVHVPAARSAAKPNTQLLTVGVGVGVALAAVILVAFARWRQRRVEVVIGKVSDDGSVKPTALEVQVTTERIVLGGIPRVEPADLPTDFHAKITVSLFGQAKITPGTARVTIGEHVVGTGSALLRVGDSFQIEFESGSGTPGSVTYVLRDIGRPADAESSLEVNAMAESRS